MAETLPSNCPNRTFECDHQFGCEDPHLLCIFSVQFMLQQRGPAYLCSHGNTLGSTKPLFRNVTYKVQMGKMKSHYARDHPKFLEFDTILHALGIGEADTLLRFLVAMLAASSSSVISCPLLVIISSKFFFFFKRSGIHVFFILIEAWLPGHIYQLT
ncbi:hypothetical protein AVEN_274726-1 [Araneus ventricosus]|uniref:Uncharacterized protein n=1 Tax=Araneus ventricosus TaxID=182803 RepID=A0A4Y2VE40_ARAVE|nr:hypothetical protein AVEN_274726-1 [Araneus ventricosus]